MCCRLITYWPARSMLTHFEEIRDAHRPSSHVRMWHGRHAARKGLCFGDQRRQITSDQNSLANLNNNHVLKSCLTLRGPFAIASFPCQASKAVHLTRCLRARLQCKAAKFSGTSGGRGAREGLWSE